MNRHLSGMLLAAGMFFAATGCNLVLNRGVAGSGTVEALAATALFQTAAVKSQSAALKSLEAPPLTATSTQQSTPTFTPTITLTSTPEKVFVTVSKNTNCRTGPEKQFDLVGIMKVGETAEAIGRNDSKTYWVIRLPSNTAKTCWLWYEWATLTGNGDALPVIQSPPTPTWSPKPDFSFSMSGIINCPVPKVIKLQVVNTGNVAWESYRVEAKDLSTDVMGTSASNDFPGFAGCGWSSASAIQPGETGFALGLSPAGSAGHSVEVILHLYTGNSSAGTHMKGDFTFTMT